MRNDSARRRPLVRPLSLRHPSRHAEVLDGLVLMMVSFLFVLWILGQVFLAFFPNLGNSAVATDGNTANGDALALGGTAGSEADDSRDNEFAEPSDADSGMNSNLRSDGDSDEGNRSNGLANAAIERYESAAAELRAEIDALKKKNESLLTQRSPFESIEPSRSAADKNEVVKLRGDLRTANEQRDAAEKNALAASQQYRDSESSFKELQNRFSEVQSQLERAKSDLASSTATTEEPRSPFAKIPNQDAAAEMFQEEVKRAEAKVDSLQGQVTSLEQKLKSANDKIKAREQELLAATKMQETQQDAAEARAFNDRVATLQRDLKLATDKMNAQAQDFAVTEKRLQEVQGANTALKKQLAVAVKRLAIPSSAGTGLAVNMKPEVFRDFTSSKGSISKMAFIRWEGDDAIIVRSFTDKRLYRLTLDRFSEADKKYLLDRK